MVNTYIENPSLEQDAQEKKIFKLINDDVMRTLPESNLFRNDKIQKMMRRYTQQYVDCSMSGTCDTPPAVTCKELTTSSLLSSSSSSQSMQKSILIRLICLRSWQLSPSKNSVKSKLIRIIAPAKFSMEFSITTLVPGLGFKNLLVESPKSSSESTPSFSAISKAKT
jgi:hypothetical protein